MRFSIILERVTKQCGQVASYELRRHEFNLWLLCARIYISAQFYMCNTMRGWLPSTVMIFGVHFYKHGCIALCVFSMPPSLPTTFLPSPLFQVV